MPQKTDPPPRPPPPKDVEDFGSFPWEFLMIGVAAIVGGIAIYFHVQSEKQIQTPPPISSAQLKQIQDLEMRVRKMEEKMGLQQTPSSERSNP